MADNVVVPTVPTGPSIATDEVDGQHYQRVKLIHGAEGANDGDVSEDNPFPVHDESAHQLLTRLLQYLNAPQGYDKSLQRARVTAVVESGTVTLVTTVTTVTTVATVTSLNNYDGYNARMTVLDTNRTAWAQCVRARIT